MNRAHFHETDGFGASDGNFESGGLRSDFKSGDVVCHSFLIR